MLQCSGRRGRRGPGRRGPPGVAKPSVADARRSYNGPAPGAAETPCYRPAPGTGRTGRRSRHMRRTRPIGHLAAAFALVGAFAFPGLLLPGPARAGESSPGVGPGRETPPETPGPTIRVPGDQPTIQQGVDAAEPGSLVLISPGVYREAVLVTTPFLTIRGLDRNTVILDGGFRMPNGIQVSLADGVAVENMTARHYLETGSPGPSVQRLPGLVPDRVRRRRPRDLRVRPAGTGSSTTRTRAATRAPGSPSGSASRATR